LLETIEYVQNKRFNLQPLRQQKKKDFTTNILAFVSDNSIVRPRFQSDFLHRGYSYTMSYENKKHFYHLKQKSRYICREILFLLYLDVLLSVFSRLSRDPLMSFETQKSEYINRCTCCFFRISCKLDFFQKVGSFCTFLV